MLIVCFPSERSPISISSRGHTVSYFVFIAEGFLADGTATTAAAAAGLERSAVGFVFVTRPFLTVSLPFSSLPASSPCAPAPSDGSA